jgi:hypothetical protein
VTEDQKEALEHDQVLKDLREVISTDQGKSFIAYLFKSFGVGTLPEQGITGDLLMDHIGYLRAGEAIFQLVSEANAQVAGTILATNKEREYAAIKQQYADANQE